MRNLQTKEECVMKKWVLAVGCMLMILITTDVFATPEMVLVKAGTFQMGNIIKDIEGSDNEEPVHTVRLTYDFYIGKYEVTFNEYDAYCEETGKSKKRDRGWGRGERPIIYVNWSEAVAYCNWLSEKEGLAKAYDSEVIYWIEPENRRQTSQKSKDTDSQPKRNGNMQPGEATKAQKTLNMPGAILLRI